MRGGKQTAFLLVDCYSQAKFKVDVSSKTHNRDAFRRIVVKNGVHKLAYDRVSMPDNYVQMDRISLSDLIST